MSFDRAQKYLDGLGVDAMLAGRPTMHRIHAICEALNHPELAIPAIHITGTNGKTSTARIATSLLAATGLTVGTYTSPHLESVRERIAINGVAISEEEFGEMFDHLRPYLSLVEARLDETLTYFEVLTALFFLWAAEAPVDVMVVEVGLGGRWDATNVVPAPVNVITNIGLDHANLLGPDRPQIAAEKAGIIKPNAAVVTAERSPEIVDIFEREAKEAGASVYRIGDAFDETENLVAIGGRYLSVRTSAAAYEELFLPLHGSHQGVNAATALEAVTRFLPAHDLDAAVVAEGFAKASVPGRVEAVPRPLGTDVSLVLDVAHNPEGVEALVSTLIEAFAFDRVTFVVGVLRDKDHEGVLEQLARVPCRVVLTEARSSRAAAAEELAAAAKRIGLEHEVIEGVPAAVSATVQRAALTELVCVTGSHYVVGEARSFLERTRSQRDY